MGECISFMAMKSPLFSSEFHTMPGNITPNNSFSVVGRKIDVIIRIASLVVQNQIKTTNKIHIIIRSSFIFIIDFRQNLLFFRFLVAHQRHPLAFQHRATTSEKPIGIDISHFA